MEYDGYDEVVRAWIQGVYDSRGNDAKRTLKFCYDIEQYALKKNDAKLLGLWEQVFCSATCRIGQHIMWSLFLTSAQVGLMA